MKSVDALPVGALDLMFRMFSEEMLRRNIQTGQGSAHDVAPTI